MARNRKPVICSVCSRPVDADRRICPGCGATRLGRVWRAPQPLDPKERSSLDPTGTVVVIALTVFFLFLVLGLAFAIISSGGLGI